MQYLSSYYWQQNGGNATSLLLQQAYHKRRKIPILLACVCTDTSGGRWGGLLMRKCADWFYNTGLPLCGKGKERDAEAVAKSLERMLESAGEDIRLSGMLCVGSRFVMFGQGEQRICLLNFRNRHPCCREVGMLKEGEGGLCLQSGLMQRGVGILLAAESFYARIPRHMLEECLDVGELRDANRVDKRLKELGELGEREGGTDMGAVLLLVK